MKIATFGFQAYAIPLGVRTSKGATSVRRGMQFYVRDVDGRTGWGDAAPWPGTDQELRLTSASLANLTAALLHGERPAADPAAIGAFCRARAVTPEATFATELALLDLLGQQRGLSVAKLLDDSPATQVRSHALVDGTERALVAVRHGFDTLKVKIGADIDSDDARLESIRAAVGAEISIRVDANGAWGRDEACWAIERLHRHRLALVEQPVEADLIADLGFVRRRVPVKIAADESVTGPVGLRRILAEHAADVIVLKPMFVGGAAQTLSLAALAVAAGVPVLVTHALESSVGRIGALHVAASLPTGCRGEICGLASDLTRGPSLTVPAGPGLGARGEAA